MWSTVDDTAAANYSVDRITSSICQRSPVPRAISVPLQYSFFPSFSSSVDPHYKRSHRFSGFATLSPPFVFLFRATPPSFSHCRFFFHPFGRPSVTFSLLFGITFLFFFTRHSLASSMTRSIGTFQRFKHDDVMRATHSVSVISHSLHDCIGPNRVRPPHTAVHLLRPPLVPPPTRRFRRCRRRHRRRQPADVDVAGSSPPSSSPSLPPPPSPPPPLLLPPTPSIEKRPVLYAPAHTLYLACVLNARDRCLSFCLHSAAYPHALLPPRRYRCCRLRSSRESSLLSLFFLSLSSNAINAVNFFPPAFFFLCPHDMINQLMYISLF